MSHVSPGKTLVIHLTASNQKNVYLQDKIFKTDNNNMVTEQIIR